MNKRKTILLVTRNFPPLIGGMERLLSHVYQELMQSFDVHLIGPEGASDFTNSSSIVSQCSLYPTFWFLIQCQCKALRLAQRLRPDLVIAGSGVTAGAAYMAGRAVGAPVACFLHGLDLVVKNRLYHSLFIPVIRRCDFFIANSTNTVKLALEVGIKNEAIRILYPAVNLMSCDAAQNFHDIAGTMGKRILLSVGRLTARKGLVQFVDNCLPKIVAAYPDVVFVIIGGEANQALHQKHSFRIKEAITLKARKKGLEGHIRFLGHVNDSILKAAYLESHLFVFPVLDLPGDIEGFGIVALEAAAYGLPTVSFASGGVPDAVAHNVSGYLVRPGDYRHFTKTILSHLEQKNIVMRDNCAVFAQKFTCSRFGEKLRKICYDFALTNC